jgi:hypothetical protein
MQAHTLETCLYHACVQWSGAETVIEVQEMIKAKKGIGVTRMVLYKQDSPKPLEDRYYSWDLNRYCFVPDHVGQSCNCQLYLQFSMKG